MNPIKQENPLGCAVACVAFILEINYQNALKFFDNGEVKADDIGFFCREIVMVLDKAGLKYNYKYLKDRIRREIYKQNTIVFIKRSDKYPAGHYLCRSNDKWMDPWINFPNKKIRVGFRKRLPGKPIYLISTDVKI